MSILLRRLSAALSLLAVLSCVPQGSLMLCAVEGGRVAIEGVCDDAAAAHADPATAAAEHDCACDGGCGPCRDSQVGAELSPGRVRDEASLGATALASPLLPTATVVPSPAAPPAPALLAAPPPRPPARVAAGVQLRL